MHNHDNVLNFGYMTLGQGGHATHFDPGHQLGEILSRPDMAVKSYGTSMDFGYV